MKIIEFLRNSFRVKRSIKKEAVDKLISVSTPDGEFLILLLLSVLIITVGLVLDNIFLVIGGMMVTPLLYPVLATGLGIAITDWKLLNRSLGGFTFSCLVAIVSSFLLARFFFAVTEISTSMINSIEPRPAYFVIAILAGVAATITWVRPNLSAALPGVGVTATLVPPLATAGISLALADWVFLRSSLALFGLSFIGIVIPSAAIFFWLKFEEVEKQVEESIEEEQKRLEG
ncbi:MAG: DUF389 domain-containing protein [Candidatus Paceibacterota bacterium]